MVSWLLVRLVTWLVWIFFVGWLIGWFNCLLVGCFGSLVALVVMVWFVCWLVGRLVGLVGWLLVLFVGWFAGFGWLVG